MKLTIGLATAFISCAAAVKDTVEVYILPRPQIHSTEAIPRSVAQLLFLQQVDPLNPAFSTKSLQYEASKEQISLGQAANLMNTFGYSASAPFTHNPDTLEKRLTVVLEGLTESQMSSFGSAFKSAPSYSVNKGSSKAIGVDFSHTGPISTACTIEAAALLDEEQCWKGDQLTLKYNVRNSPTSVNDVQKQITTLTSAATAGTIRTSIILAPNSARNGQSLYWTEESSGLVRRQTEQPLKSADNSHKQSPNPTNSPAGVFVASGPIPACFKNKESCESATGHCTGHGECVNKYAKGDNPESKDVCFTCKCKSLPDGDNGAVTSWGGNKCQKKDVSGPFLLFFAFTVALVGILAMAIGALYSIGEEKLPGVIGAGVSKGKN